MTTDPATIRTARESANLTQAQAAVLVHVAARTWRQWEAGQRTMPAGLWELFRIKTGAAA